MCTVITLKNRKRFDRFTPLGFPRFSDIIGENSYEFLIYCCEKFYKLGLLESHLLCILLIS